MLERARVAESSLEKTRSTKRWREKRRRWREKRRRWMDKRRRWRERSQHDR
jgi:hypothetical protein